MRILIVALAFALAAGASDAKSCKDPKTGQFVKCAASATSSAANTAATTTTSAAGSAASSMAGAPHCKTGKPCGGSCIAKNKVCHK